MSERFGTYLSFCNHDVEKACRLYIWNMAVSSAFFPWLSMVEVVLRNRIHSTLIQIHSPQWPWADGFGRMLPSSGFNPKNTLQNSRLKHTKSKQTGKVVADLSFAFWQHLLTKRYANSLWNKHLMTAFPNLDSSKTVVENLKFLHTQIEAIRMLRNRIAHHEPIYRRDLNKDYENIQLFIKICQSEDFIKWMERDDGFSLLGSGYLAFLLNQKPQNTLV
ncbi:Abi family protein [Neisseria chenwenguii]|uniref:Uncharacterized protein n=1 Tax=Neisseria chenwenguii TaxID=1853278 RepID=A0A220S0E9_9NEIS|nr:Abi family protein [Neisseria chenwenguii]ASK26960.1 hypothetical protein BG910_03690 [Neisseria chenwenguii]ROV56138.1 hypothetical protein EGS38_06680 [Neisseria chenwenguii]